MTTFATRVQGHEGLRQEVARILRAAGCIVAAYGQENLLPRAVRVRLRTCEGLCAAYLRFQPDLVVIWRQRCWLAEIKSDISHSDNIAYELDSKALADRLWSIGISVLCIFSGMRVAWAHEIRFKRYFHEVPEDWHGSGTPFGLIDEGRSGLRALGQFITDELGATHA